MRASVFLVAASLTASSATADPGEIDRVLVLDLVSTGVEANLARNLSEVFALSIRKALPRTTVLGQGEITSMLAMERQRDLLGCQESISCLAEVGGALGADHMATGSVGRVGSTFLLTLKLVNVKQGKTVQHITEEVAGNEDQLIEATRQWGTHLADPSRPAGVGYIDAGAEATPRWRSNSFNNGPQSLRESIDSTIVVGDDLRFHISFAELGTPTDVNELRVFTWDKTVDCKHYDRGTCLTGSVP